MARVMCGMCLHSRITTPNPSDLVQVRPIGVAKPLNGMAEVRHALGGSRCVCRRCGEPVVVVWRAC